MNSPAALIALAERLTVVEVLTTEDVERLIDAFRDEAQFVLGQEVSRLRAAKGALNRLLTKHGPGASVLYRIASMDYVVCRALADGGSERK